MKLTVLRRACWLIASPLFTAAAIAHCATVGPEFDGCERAYYVVFRGAAADHVDRKIRLPYTGGETVLDALAQVGDLPNADAAKIWIERYPAGRAFGQRLPVLWGEIAEQGIETTNYPLMPGDRLVIVDEGNDYGPVISAGAASAATLLLGLLICIIFSIPGKSRARQ